MSYGWINHKEQLEFTSIRTAYLLFFGQLISPSSLPLLPHGFNCIPCGLRPATQAADSIRIKKIIALTR